MNRLQKIPSIPQTILAILHEIGSGAIQAFFPHPYSHLFCTHKNPRSFRPAFSRLQKIGLIKRNGEIFYLTRKGEKDAFLAFLNAEVSSYKPRKNQKWDGKWRMILFDIPEKKKSHREYLRTILKTLGFKEFQKSVWIHPFKIPDFLTRLLLDENILPYTQFITTNNINNDWKLRKLFGLLNY